MCLSNNSFKQPWAETCYRKPLFFAEHQVEYSTMEYQAELNINVVGSKRFYFMFMEYKDLRASFLIKLKFSK